jgi:hypothetical protein
MVNPKLKIMRLDSGKTVGSCELCHTHFESGAPDRATAEMELRRMFDVHQCILPKKKSRKDVD